jgi:hypothetical protein
VRVSFLYFSPGRGASTNGTRGIPVHRRPNARVPVPTQAQQMAQAGRRWNEKFPRAKQGTRAAVRLLLGSWLGVIGRPPQGQISLSARRGRLVWSSCVRAGNSRGTHERWQPVPRLASNL